MASDITSKASVTQSLQEDYTDDVIAENEAEDELSCHASNSNDTLQEGLSEQYASMIPHYFNKTAKLYHQKYDIVSLSPSYL